MRVLFLLFIVVPVVEMWLLITVGREIGALWTIGLVLLTAFIGVALLRYQGAMTLLRARMKMGSGQLPAREMADGVFFAVAGALLLTPGFATDGVGFACLVPGVRSWLIGLLMPRLMGSMSASGGGARHQDASDAGAQKTTSATTIEGEFKRDDE